ncbi:hypothetical protein F5Y03DRAFT_365621 [Xylaria venustula]|nr:hypothetical protein F5Y03DRAFT_365621 [Xylaria venustula]
MKNKPQELEDAICNVIQIIKQIPELADTRLAVVGDLALWHHLPTRRETNVRPPNPAARLWDLSLLVLRLLILSPIFQLSNYLREVAKAPQLFFYIRHQGTRPVFVCYTEMMNLASWGVPYSKRRVESSIGTRPYT